MGATKALTYQNQTCEVEEASIIVIRRFPGEERRYSLLVERVVLLELVYDRLNDIGVLLMLGMAFIVRRRKFKGVRTLFTSSFAITVLAAIA